MVPRAEQNVHEGTASREQIHGDSGGPSAAGEGRAGEAAFLELGSITGRGVGSKKVVTGIQKGCGGRMGGRREREDPAGRLWRLG